MRLFMIRCMILILFLFFMFPTIGQSVEAIPISAQNAVMLEQQTGRVMYDKNAHERKPIASITKVMTAILAIESGKLQDEVIASHEAIHTPGSSIYLQLNEKISLEDLLYGLMLRSGNDAAVAIAEHIGGSEEGFVYLMNEKAKYLGMTNTNFQNAHGLDEERHYSSAYDIALLMRYAMENDIFREISSTQSYQSKNRTYPWNNKNKLLTRYYEHCTGGKTGYTSNAGRTLVTTAEKDDLELVTVTLNAPDDWNDHRALFDWGYDHYRLTKLENEGERKFQLENEEVTGYITEDVVFPLLDEEKKTLKKHVYLQKKPKDEKLGTIVYQLDSEPILEVPVYVKEDNNEHSFFKRLFQSVKRIIWLDSHG